MAKKSNEINIIIRILPKGEEVDVELDVTTTGKEIISELIFFDIKRLNVVLPVHVGPTITKTNLPILLFQSKVQI